MNIMELEIGETYGAYRILSKTDRRNRPKENVLWVGLCSICHGQKESTARNFLRLKTNRCLCGQGSGEFKRAHGLAYHPYKSTWDMMRARCYIETNKSFPDYGGRGIYICDEWLDPAKYSGLRNFLTWIEEQSGWDGDKKLTIDRFPDLHGPYAPWNCRLVPGEVNCRITRRTHMVEINGEMMLGMDAAEKFCEAGSKVFLSRLKHGFSMTDAVTQPLASYPVDLCNVKRNIIKWLKENGFGYKKRSFPNEVKSCIIDLDKFFDQYLESENE